MEMAEKWPFCPKPQKVQKMRKFPPGGKSGKFPPPARGPRGGPRGGPPPGGVPGGVPGGSQTGVYRETPLLAKIVKIAKKTVS